MFYSRSCILRLHRVCIYFFFFFINLPNAKSQLIPWIQTFRCYPHFIHPQKYPSSKIQSSIVSFNLWTTLLHKAKRLWDIFQSHNLSLSHFQNPANVFSVVCVVDSFPNAWFIALELHPNALGVASHCFNASARLFASVISSISSQNVPTAILCTACWCQSILACVATLVKRDFTPSFVVSCVFILHIGNGRTSRSYRIAEMEHSRTVQPCNKNLSRPQDIFSQWLLGYGLWSHSVVLYFLILFDF